MSVTWDEALPIAKEAFQIWVRCPEIHWAEQAWAHLTSGHLTSNRSSRARLASYVRFLVLASLYRDWCAIVWDEVHDDEPSSWLCEVEVNRILVGQLLGPDVELSDDEESSLTDALFILMEREHQAVVAALLEGFDGVDGLFLALWRSKADPAPGSENDEDDDCNDRGESDADILNNVTTEKAAGYEWIQEGCESRGPVRFNAETGN